MLQPGTPIGRYEVQRRLGRGGMGTVYVAHDPVLGRMVAIKVFLSDLDLPDAAERFSREARAAAALNHANIVTIHDFGDWQSQPYIVMEYVQGETLAEIIRRKAPLPAADKLRLVEELCAGVSYAHQIGVIHRDIKPTNLMVDRSGRLKILDFGIAKMLGTLGSNATALIGTPGYMAPEQIVGGAIDQRSDLFSIAVVLYEFLSYTEAFPGDTVHSITHRIIHDEPVSLTTLIPDVSPTLVAIVERGLRKAAADRFADAESFRQALAGVRRDLESGPGWSAASPARGAGPLPGATLQRGTGSARRHVGEAVGVAELTPPPDPRKTDREALARRRAAQIEAALDLARLSLDQQELERALDACQQALTLDDTHAAALELEQSIKALLAKKRAGELVADARDELAHGALTAAQDLLQQARSLDPEAPEAKRLERDLKLARIEQERLRQRAEAVQKAVAEARAALDRSEVEAALALAREAVDLDPESVEARAVEADAMRRLDEEIGQPDVAQSTVAVPIVDKTILAPARRTPPPAPSRTAGQPAVAAPAPVRTKPRTDRWGEVRRRAAAAQAAVASASPRVKLVVAGAVALTLVALVIAIRPPAVVPTGGVVIDAVPWASIVAIEAENGSAVPLPSPASTPVLLTIPVGSYRIRVTGPPPAAEARVLTVQVQEGSVASPPVERFETLTPETYFEGYLTAPGAATEAPAAPAETPPPTPDAPPSSGAPSPPSPPGAVP